VLLRRLVGDELGEKLFGAYQGIPLQQCSVSVEMLGDAANPFFDDRGTPQVEGRDDLVRASFSEAVAWLAEHAGPDPGEWRWGRLHSVTLVHLPLGQSGIGPLEAIFNSDTLPARGAAFTVDAATPSVGRPFVVVSGASQRFIADLAELENSRAVLTTGQSGHAFHRHREDQVGLWQEVEDHPMPFRRERIEVEGVLILRPD
jgi:penicillin amidase